MKNILIFKDNIWSADFADMQQTSKYNKKSQFLLNFTDIFSIYAWPNTVTNASFKNFRSV